jgi:hypothetical protein
MTARTKLILVPILLAPSVLAADDVPKDVAEFLERGELCKHFWQEPWPEGGSKEEKQRRDFISRQMEEFCPGLSEVGSKLREKYSDKPSVLEKLNETKEWVE